MVDSSLEERRAAAEAARQLLEGEVKSFDFWRQTLTIAPTIAAMSDHLHQVCRAEIERFHRKLQGLTPEQEKVVEELVRSVVQKILHPAIRTLKGSLQQGRAAERANLYRQIFHLVRHVASGGAQAPAGPHRVLQGGKE